MKRDLVLWLTIFAGPVLWMLSFGADWTLVPWACAWGWKPVLYVISSISAAVCASSGFIAWRYWGELAGEGPRDFGGPLSRARMMAMAGVLLSAMFTLVIAVQSAAHFILGACE